MITLRVKNNLIWEVYPIKYDYEGRPENVMMAEKGAL
jgi:hypothetical protein